MERLAPQIQDIIRGCNLESEPQKELVQSTMYLSVLTPLPSNATVGYRSGTRIFQCTDGATYEKEWSLEGADGNNAIYSVTSRLNLNSGVVSTSERYTITPDMAIIAYESIIDGGGKSLQVYATSISQQ
jgi:hypothetical protein